MKLKNGYYTNRHSCYLLQYHLVLVTKFRRPVLQNGIDVFLLDYTKNYFLEQGVKILEINVMPDHIHILFEAPPQLCLSTFVNAFKSASSRLIRGRFVQEVKQYYWKPLFWSLSYFVATVSERSAEAVQRYIQQQKE